jgi:uncharacterized membrane protein
MKDNIELQRQAREDLKDKWPLVVGAAALYMLFAGLGHVAWPPGGIVSFILTGPMTLGLSIFFLTIVRGGRPELSVVFKGFNRFGTAFIAHLFMVVFIILWSLLLVVPGIMAALSYAMTFFIIADNPEIEASAAIRRSKELMEGKRWQLLCLLFRFLGWFILCLLSFGIGFLWLIPYVQTTLARFYEQVRRMPGDFGVSGLPPAGDRSGTPA